MADLMAAGASGYATGSLDTATTQADDDPNPTIGEANAAKINGMTSAIVQIENVLGIGTDLKGTAADLVARLAVEHNASGSHKTLTVPSGGTGLATVTPGGVLGGNGTSAMQDSGVGAATQVLISNVTAAPSWGYGLLYHGPSACNTGSTRTHEGAIVISVNQNLSGIHYYTNFTIDAGVTVSVPAGKRRLIIVATGVITINGTIYSVGAGGAGATTADAAGDGTDQAGGGGGSTGHAGGSAVCHGVTVQAGGAAGTPGANPTQVSGSDVFMFNSPFMVTGGAGGGDDGATSSSGGAGGGSVVLIAPTIVLGAASFIDTRGVNGTQNGTSGSAGGGAGNIYILTRTFTDNGCTFQQTGGTLTGGVAGGGGAGAAGVKQILIYG